MCNPCNKFTLAPLGVVQTHTENVENNKAGWADGSVLMLGLSQPTDTYSTSWQENSPSQEHEENFWFGTDVFHRGHTGANLPPDDVAEQVNHILLPLREKKRSAQSPTGTHGCKEGGGSTRVAPNCQRTTCRDI